MLFRSFQDSFFAPDNRLDNSLTGESAAYESPRFENREAAASAAFGDALPDDLSGVIVEGEPRYPSTGTHH